MSGSSPHSEHSLLPDAMWWLERSRDSKSPSNARTYAEVILGRLHELEEQLEARDRWAGFTHRETQDMHHALRMFAKYPGLSDEEAVGYTALADEIWDRHAAQTAAAYPAKRPS